jgi:Ni,Fe-hydrogenase III large subunit/Ni,Fe-hydrogenase III component G
MLRALLARSTELPGAPDMRRLATTLEDWQSTLSDVAATGARLLALWTERAPAAVHAAFLCDGAALVVDLELDYGEMTYPGLSDFFPAATRMQRAAADLTGVSALDADTRPWLRHSAWPREYKPLAPRSIDYAGDGVPPPDDYAFVRVSGDGVHEIPVGPVHAGIIEPGHFRFSIVGEKVLKLEERLGYAHKGIERLFARTKLDEGHRLAARVSGDSAVAFSWAYCQALEGLARCEVPERAVWLRALALEAERIANHLGDLGFIGNDAGLAFALAQCSRLKEDVLRLNQTWTEHRYMMDAIVPGGVACDLVPHVARLILEQNSMLLAQVRQVKAMFDDHSGLQDRLIGTGRVAPELADRLGLCGLAGRASGAAWDLRVQFPCTPYDRLEVHIATHRNGDVAARTIVRFEEVLESLDLCSAILDRMPSGDVRVEMSVPLDGSLGVGWIEGWRGEVMIALEAGPGGTLKRVHPHDPSWQNWPLLEHAVIGNIVPDFPLINKSFNLSYSGVDL